MVPDNSTRGSGVNTEHPLFRQSGQPPPLKSIHVLPPGGNGSGGRLLYTAAHHGRSASISVASTQHPHNAIDTKLEPTYPWDYDEDEDVSCLAADVVSLTRGPTRNTYCNGASTATSKAGMPWGTTFMHRHQPLLPPRLPLASVCRVAEVLGSTMTTTRVLTACSAGAGTTTAMTPQDTETSGTADQRGSPSANILSDAYTFRIQSGKYASESSQTPGLNDSL